MKNYAPELGIYVNTCDDVKRFYIRDDEREFFVT